MSEVIQSLSICCPSKTGKCINHCATCTARQHENPYNNMYDGNHCQTFDYWENVIKRMRYAQSKGCTTVMLTGSNEPQQNRRWLESLALAMKALPEPFVNIEIQTTGAFMDEDYVRFLKKIGVTTFALSTFNIFDDAKNRGIIGTPDGQLSVEKICRMVTDAGMNLRICVNVTDYVLPHKFESMTEASQLILERCRELGANQVTFRKMWSNPGTAEANWIQEHCGTSDVFIGSVTDAVVNHGTIINRLPYGAIRYDYLGFSIVVDVDSMAKDETNMATKYYIIRENGKMYSSWDSPASIVF